MTTPQTNSIFTSTHAIIFGVCADAHVIDGELPLCQLPLGPKPIVQHVVESAVRLGAKTVDVVISEGAQEIRQLLGDGQRFGVRLRIHLIADSQHPYSVFRFLCRSTDEAAASRKILLHTSHLVFLENLQAAATVDSGESIVLKDAHGDWTGVAEVCLHKLRALAAAELTFETLASVICEAETSCIDVSDVLRLDTPAAILDSQARVLNDEFPELVENYRSAEKGIWIGRNAKIHPTATIIAPVFVSENCDIDAGATIGPGVWLGERTIVGTGAVISNSIVLSMSSVGEELTIQDSIVSRSHVLNTRIGISLNIVDDLLLGDLTHKTLTQSARLLVSRLTGLVLFLMTIPVLGAYWLVVSHRCRLRLVTRKYVRTPAPTADFLWRTIRLASLAIDSESRSEVSPRRLLWRDLCTRIIPSLSQVAMGHVRLLGVTPRTVSEAADVPEFWKAILLTAPSGLITESLAQAGADVTEEQRCSSDVWFAMSPRRFKAQWLFARYIRALIQGPPVRNIGQSAEKQRGTADAADSEHAAGSEHHSLVQTFLETEHAGH